MITQYSTYIICTTELQAYFNYGIKRSIFFQKNFCSPLVFMKLELKYMRLINILKVLTRTYKFKFFSLVK